MKLPLTIRSFASGIAVCALAAATPQTQSAGAQAPANSATNATCVSVFLGTPGGLGEVRVYDDLTGAPLGGPAFLKRVRLLPLDFVGRTELSEFDPELPRRRDDVPGAAARLVLPGGRGSLYHYGRVTQSGTVFGYLWLDSFGRPIALGERAGTGAGAQTNPYLRRIGVAPDGGALLIATTAAAGGDLLELELSSRRVVDRTPHLAPLHLSDAGLWLTDGWGFGVADEGIFRFTRAPGAQANALGFDAETPVWFAGDAVVSRARTFAAATAGAGPTEQHVWVFNATGPARRVSRVATSLSGAGFLPESQDGPFLAVADDGAMAAWRSEGVTRELYLVRALPIETPDHVSADDNFHDTFDEVGQISFYQPDELTFGLGGRDEPVAGGLEKMDVYTARLDANGALQLENRSMTSGDSVAPFDSVPAITPEAAHALPAGLLMHDDDTEELIALRVGQTGLHTFLTDVKEVTWMERSGDFLVVCLRRSFGSKPWQLFRVRADLTGAALLLDPGGSEMEFLSPAPGPDGWVGYLARNNDVQDFARRVHAASATVEAWNTTATTLTPPFGHSPLGRTLLTHGPGNGPSTFQLWPYASATLPLQVPPGAGHLLPSH